MSGVLREADAARQEHPDRWSKDLVGGSSPVKATGGFNAGVAEYFAAEFAPLQRHDDQEAVYVISGVGEITVAGKVYAIEPGTAVYVPPGGGRCPLPFSNAASRCPASRGARPAGARNRVQKGTKSPDARGPRP